MRTQDNPRQVRDAYWALARRVGARDAYQRAEQDDRVSPVELGRFAQWLRSLPIEQVDPHARRYETAGGRVFYKRRSFRLTISERRRLIHQLVSAGVPTGEIAAAAGCSRRTVERAKTEVTDGSTIKTVCDKTPDPYGVPLAPAAAPVLSRDMETRSRYGGGRTIAEALAQMEVAP